jgi:phasin
VAQEQKPFDELSAMARQTIAQFQSATEQYFSLLQKRMSSSPWDSNDLTKKVFSMAQQNATASFEFVQRLSRAKDLQDFLRIQSEFMQSQLSTYSEQLADISEASRKAAEDAIKKTPQQEQQK